MGNRQQGGDNWDILRAGGRGTRGGKEKGRGAEPVILPRPAHISVLSRSGPCATPSAVSADLLFVRKSPGGVEY